MIIGSPSRKKIRVWGKRAKEIVLGPAQRHVQKMVADLPKGYALKILPKPLKNGRGPPFGAPKIAKNWLSAFRKGKP